eukprot:1794048-Pyramimonas_sp.AAC.1
MVTFRTLAGQHPRAAGLDGDGPVGGARVDPREDDGPHHPPEREEGVPQGAARHPPGQVSEEGVPQGTARHPPGQGTEIYLFHHFPGPSN